jgi:hypothetical protein
MPQISLVMPPHSSPNHHRLPIIYSEQRASIPPVVATTMFKVLIPFCNLLDQPRKKNKDSSLSYNSELAISDLFDFALLKSHLKSTCGLSSFFKDRGSSLSRHMRRERRGTRTRPPVSFRHDLAVVPYSLRSSGSKSNISYNGIALAR